MVLFPASDESQRRQQLSLNLSFHDGPQTLGDVPCFSSLWAPKPSGLRLKCDAAPVGGGGQTNCVHLNPNALPRRLLGLFTKPSDAKRQN